MHVAGKAPGGFVFSAEKGGVLHSRNFRRSSFAPAVRATGLEGLTPHALRHAAASLAIASGANVKVVQTMLGHQSAPAIRATTASADHHHPSAASRRI